MTAVDRPDNGQDEGPVLVARCENYREDLDQPCTGTLRYRCGMIQAACDTCGAWCGIAVADWLTVVSGRAGAGEQQRERVMDALMYAIGEEMPMGVVWNLDRVTDRLISALPELLALLGGPRPDGEPEPCPVYSHGTDGWHCAVTGDHDQHHNAAGTETW